MLKEVYSLMDLTRVFWYQGVLYFPYIIIDISEVWTFLKVDHILVLL